uniref:Lg2 n=1 Tax=Arundo donax TaxID=35708 RepID=A0A0A9H9T4_ARUDO
MHSSTMSPRLPSSRCACSPPRRSASRLLSSSSHRAYSISNMAAPELMSPAALHPPTNRPCDRALWS